MIRYYSKGFDRGTQSIGRTEKKIVDLLLSRLPVHICLINSTWLGDDLKGLKEFIDQTTCTEVAVYSGPDWENTSEPGKRIETHRLLEDKFEKVHHIGNTNKGYYFSFWLEFIKDNWKYFNKEKYKSEPKLVRSATVGKNGKHFLCYNRKPHDHRVGFMNKLMFGSEHGQGLSNFGIVSATIEDPRYTFRNPIILDESHDSKTFRIINEWEGQNENDIISLGDAENWQRHFLTVVTETTIHTDVLLSEKTFKPIIGLRPFIILGDQNLYKKLVEMGFDVFEDMFPDILISLSHPDYEKRINYILEQLTNLSAFSLEELDEKYKELHSRLEANRARLDEVIDENSNRIENIDEVFKSKEQNSIQVPWDYYFDMETFAKDYPPQQRRDHWKVGQWNIGMPANDQIIAKHTIPVDPPFIVDRSFHNPNDIFYLWFDKLTNPLQGNMYQAGNNHTVGEAANMQWWYEFAELNYKLMDIEKFNENVHGKNHPLHNYYFIEIASLDSMASLVGELPDKIQELLRKRMMQLVFVFPHEGFHTDAHWWMEKLNAAIVQNNLSGIYSYFIFGDINFKRNYDQWVSSNPMGEQGKFTKAIGYDYFQFLYRQQYTLRTDPLEVGLFTMENAVKFIAPGNTYERETLHTVPTAEDKTHDLLNFNGLPRPHRLAIVSELHRLGFDETSYISFLLRYYGDVEGEREYRREWQTNLVDVADQLFKYKSQKDHLLEFFAEPKHIELDVTTDELKQDDRFYDKSLYESSYFSLVNETIFTEPDNKQKWDTQLFITEKTYKPLMNFHPFIVVSLPYTLRYLRQQGFQTFPEMFDEYYDVVKDPVIRFEYIIKELTKWKNYSEDEKNHRYNSIRPKLAFNKWHFLHKNKLDQLKTRKKDMLLSLHPYKNND